MPYSGMNGSLEDTKDFAILTTISWLRDEINKTIHRKTPPSTREIQLCVVLHELEKDAHARGIVVPHYQHRPHKYQIPDSLLVQAFMRKFRNGLDRR